jgi:prepilin-type N-terminal cleavage/methylation domain-containing protein
MSAPRNARRRAGFTLVELMVALTTGLVAIGTIYTFSTGATRFFQQQSAISQTQQGVRVAFERLRRDVSRAGFGGVPFGNLVHGPIPTMRVQAVEICDGNGLGRIPNEAENFTHADRLILTGNYETGDTYLAAAIGAGGTSITFQQTWPAFQRSFGDRISNVCIQSQFDNVFQAGRLVHVKSREGGHFFATIAGTAANCAVQLATGLPVGTSFLAGVGEGAVVTPLSRIEYTVLDQPQLAAAGLGNLVSTNPAAQALGDVPAVLVRRELTFGTSPCGNDTVRPNTTEIVLEYVAHFDVDAISDTAIPPNLPALIFEDDGLVQTRSSGVVQILGPHQFRSLVVSLAGRTPAIDRNVPWVPRTDPATQPLSRFRVNPNDTHAARVRSIRSEITLPNLFPLTQR